MTAMKTKWLTRLYIAYLNAKICVQKFLLKFVNKYELENILILV